MKKLTTLIAALLLLTTTVAEAKKVKPCNNIAKACKAAGFNEKNKKNGKGTKANCILPLVNGKAVEGVSVAAEEVAACAKTITTRKEKRAEIQKEALKKRTENHDAP